MRALLSLLRERRAYLAAAALIGIAGGAANARLIGLVNDELAAGAAPPSSPLLFLVLVAAAFLTGALSEAMLVVLSERVAHHLRVNLCAQILRLPLSAVERHGKAQLTAVLTQDLPTVCLALLRIPTLLVNAAITLGCLLYLGMLSPAVLALFAAFLVVGLTSYVVPERRAVRSLAVSRRAWDALLADFDTLNQGAKELKLHLGRRLAFFTRLRAGSSEQVRRTASRQRLIYAVLGAWAHALFFLFVAVLLYLAPGYLALDGRTLTGFAIVTLYLVGPIDLVINSLPRFRAADVAFAKVQAMGLVLDARQRPAALLEEGSAHAAAAEAATAEDAAAGAAAAATAALAPPVVRELALCGVTHAYFREKEERDFSLGPIDLTVAAGQLVLITGGNGSGKTTLAKLIVGLYLPAAGELRLNGEPIAAHNRERYRQCFSAVFSDFHVFDQLHGHVADASLDERARGYLRKLHLEHKVTVHQGRLSTTALSSGQRKRLALLVAYLEDRPIYLFDEWAADQDPEFKEVFYHQLLPELRQRGKTVIAITHDDRYFGVADRLVRLRDGQLVPAVELPGRPAAPAPAASSSSSA